MVMTHLPFSASKVVSSSVLLLLFGFFIFNSFPWEKVEVNVFQSTVFN